jgi:hypothetical protein
MDIEVFTQLPQGVIEKILCFLDKETLNTLYYSINSTIFNDSHFYLKYKVLFHIYTDDTIREGTYLSIIKKHPLYRHFPFVTKIELLIKNNLPPCTHYNIKTFLEDNKSYDDSVLFSSMNKEHRKELLGQITNLYINMYPYIPGFIKFSKILYEDLVSLDTLDILVDSHDIKVTDFPKNLKKLTVRLSCPKYLYEDNVHIYTYIRKMNIESFEIFIDQNSLSSSRYFFIDEIDEYLDYDCLYYTNRINNSTFGITPK